MGTVAAGIAIGLPVTWWVSRLVTSQLYGVAPGDPFTMIGANLLLGGAAALAGYLPARRAARVDPPAALRQE